jgi:hypothetical protein
MSWKLLSTKRPIVLYRVEETRLIHTRLMHTKLL